MSQSSAGSRTAIFLGTFLACGAAGGVGSEAGRPLAPPTVARARYLMGTRLSITLPAPAPEGAFEAAFSEVERLEDVMSNWRPTSEISRLNRTAAGSPFRCSPDLFEAIREALRWARETRGAFDPTVEPLVDAFGIRDPDGRLPSGAGAVVEEGAGTAGNQEAADAPVGWRHVRLEASARTVAFDRAGVGIDLGGIGKGIALDAAAGVLERHGFGAALLDFGGQVLAVGAPPGAPAWWVGVSDPVDREKALAWIPARACSVSSSGNGERSVQGPGGPVGHILDPIRRAPAGFTGSVTVVARDATSADALSTGLFVMGPDRGARWAERRGLAALFQWSRPDGTLERRATARFAGLLGQGSGVRTPEP